MSTRTIKLVIIGESGVGKTSFRGQYISGQFSTGYKATIGTDFISKSLPHHRNPEESVTLQIWDTAGQERFSSLAAAFFRGADAVVLMFDVNKPETLGGLEKWWQSFKERAPVPEGEEEDYCCVLVGNKVDLADGAGDAGGKETVSAARAERFMEELIPRKTANAVSPDAGSDSDGDGADDSASSAGDGDGDDHEQLQPGGNGHADPAAADALSRHSPPKSDSIQIYRPDTASSHPYASKKKAGKPEPPPPPPREPDSQGRGRRRLVSPSSRSVDRLLSHFVVGGGGGTMTTTHTIYHTPSSSLFESESFASAQSSMYSSMSSVNVNTTHLSHESVGVETTAAPPASVSMTSDATPTPGPAPFHARRLTSASSSSSAPTITPSLYQRAHASSSTAVLQPSPLGTPSTPGAELPSTWGSGSEPPSVSPNATAVLEANGNTDPHLLPHHQHRGLPPHPDRRPKLFFTSAKTGAGVAAVFEYVARRVVMKWEYEEALEERRMHVREATETIIRLAEARRRSNGLRGVLTERVSCCSS